jgi:NADPH-dependent glutamate synthase beta subunit-like oxidoreductase
LGVPEAEQYIGKGLVYQNPFIYWYNHKNEKDYLGPRYETPDEAVVVGGGLASIDVVKVLQLENYERAFRSRGIHTSMHELEKGIPEVCKTHGVKPEELGVKGCLLIYRRREQDMPLAQPPDNATPEQIARTEQVRQKMLRLARDKYLFRFQDRRLTTGIIVQDGRLAGLKVVETKIEGRKANPISGSEHELRTPLVLSSIGSVPEKLSGIDMNGEYYTFAGKDVPRYTAMDRVFGVGNVVTGQGNIRVSLVHSQKVTKRVVDCMKGDDGNGGAGASAEQQVASAMDAIGKQIEVIPQLSDDQMAEVERQVHALQQKAGFTSDYDSWIAKVTPPDLE